MLVALILYVPAVVAQQLEHKGLISLSYCLKFIQIVGYLAICAILAHHITVNEQYTNAVSSTFCVVLQLWQTLVCMQARNAIHNEECMNIRIRIIVSVCLPVHVK